MPKKGREQECSDDRQASLLQMPSSKSNARKPVKAATKLTKAQHPAVLGLASKTRQANHLQYGS
jgi:hypothetical protein